MATVGFWPVRNNLKSVIDYAENPDKTTEKEYLDDDLFNALRYAENDDKTDRKLFVSGINCSKFTAYEEMTAIKKRYGDRGKVVAYHGYQSFASGEVTPEQAHAIGVETARRMWGNRHQVIVTTHLNTDNLHNHFVVNSVSFKDGLKFRNQIGDHKELRKISDAICREQGLSVLENSDFYGGHKKDYWIHKNGQKTHQDILREDIEYCLTYASTTYEFERQLGGLGYTIDPTRFSVKAKNWGKAVRLAKIGFTKDIVNERLQQNRDNRYFHTLEWNNHLPYKPKKFPLEGLLKELEFDIEHSYKPETVLVAVLFYILITVFKIIYEMKDTILLSPDLRAAEKDLKAYIADYQFLQSNHIHTIPELQNCITKTQEQIADLEAERNKISNKIRRPKSPEEQAENKERRKAVTTEITPLRKKLKQAEKILEKSPHLYELLKTEHELEKKARSRYLERSR